MTELTESPDADVVEWDHPVEDLSGTVLLKYLDPYGDAVFNALQIPDILTDLENLRLRTKQSDVERIARLAQRVASGEHEYLVFLGD